MQLGITGSSSVRAMALSWTLPLPEHARTAFQQPVLAASQPVSVKVEKDIPSVVLVADVVHVDPKADSSGVGQLEDVLRMSAERRQHLAAEELPIMFAAPWLLCGILPPEVVFEEGQAVELNCNKCRDLALQLQADSSGHGILQHQPASSMSDAPASIEHDVHGRPYLSSRAGERCRLKRAGSGGYDDPLVCVDSSGNQIVISASGSGPPHKVSDLLGQVEAPKILPSIRPSMLSRPSPWASPESGSEMLVMNTCVCKPELAENCVSSGGAEACGESCMFGCLAKDMVTGGFSTPVAVASQTRRPNPRLGETCASGCEAEAMMTSGSSTPLANAWQVLSPGPRHGDSPLCCSGAEPSMSGGTNTPLADVWQRGGNSTP